MTAPAINIDGICKPRFARVREEFERNLAERGDVGASVSVTIGNQPVVDLWGGWANEDRTHPWQSFTIVNVWSLGKAVVSICLLRLVDAGLVDLDAPVATYWPEFAQAGKGAVTVRQLLSHQAGLVAVKPLLTLADVADPDRLAAKIAATARSLVASPPRP